MARKDGIPDRETARRIGKTQQYVSARIGLLRLPPTILQLVTSQLVNPEHGYELSKIEDPRKRALLADLCRKDREHLLTLRQLREMRKLSLEELSRIVAPVPATGVQAAPSTTLPGASIPKPVELRLLPLVKTSRLDLIVLLWYDYAKSRGYEREFGEFVEECVVGFFQQKGLRLGILQRTSPEPCVA